ncbi:unnamed protein product [Blepharisma stoltei]|uniref:AB hydrolase-1 domain-containing protein n=1 Tax=Blepharisma stoltei TaxID=1481888 RepID=A0AAU9K8J6_9CILI|nr:unnamed protein product [Blepharisma stoltei]
MSIEIKSQYITTPRLTHYVLESGLETGIPVIFVHGNVITSAYFKQIMLQMPSKYHCYAYDQRCYGRSSGVSIDATKGLKDFSDDLYYLMETLNIPKAHLLGWSLGGGVVMQFATEHSDRILSITLEASISPYGYYGTKDERGTLIFPDAAGSGVGPSALNLKSLFENKNIDENDPKSMVGLFRNAFCKPGNRLPEELEREYIEEIYLTKIGDDFIPGNYQACENWPGWCPGDRGLYNAISSKCYNVESIINIEIKPPIVWIRGEDDIIISDNCLLDPANLGASGKISNYPGEEVYPKQPMVRQIRSVLERYQENGGRYREFSIQNCGHSPQLEKEAEFLSIYLENLEENSSSL